MTTAPHSSVHGVRERGRPRDDSIDGRVLEAARSVLAERGYAATSVAAIARAAGTTKPAIYRRWATKAELVHEAAFPTDGPGGPGPLPASGSLADDIAEMVRRAFALFTSPTARAAMPGLIAEIAADPELHAAMMRRFENAMWLGLDDRLAAARARGEVRADVTSVDLVETMGGSIMLALLIRQQHTTDDWAAWTDRLAALITKGIST